jgi:tetratricopeptide (TPR) repeat protein
MKKILFIIAIAYFLFGENISSIYNSSYYYEQIGKHKEAIRVLVPLIKKYPNGYTLNLRLGWLYYLSKNYSNCVKYYNKATLLNPLSVEPKLGLANLYLTTNSFKKAEIKSYEVLKIDYYNYYANIYIIKSLIAQKKYDIADSIINKMLKIYPTDISFLELLAMLYKKTKNKYLPILNKNILVLDPNNIFIKNMMSKK